jgi:alpha-aminoadipate carrier protein LysW
MVTCPECDSRLDIEEEELDEGDVISCEECGATLRVLGLDPLELESTEEDEDDVDEESLDDDDESWQ